MRTSKLTIVMALALAGTALAQPTEYWNQAFPKMMNQDKASSWVASEGDSLSKIVNSTYKIPINKMTTLNRVIDAVIAFNNAMSSNREIWSEGKVTLIKDRNLILKDKMYFLPDPKSIDRILKGENPNQVALDSLSDPENRSQADGNPSKTPLHGFAEIDVPGADGDVAPPPGGTAPKEAQPLGDPGAKPPIADARRARDEGKFSVLGLQHEGGPAMAAGGDPTVSETREELSQNGGNEGAWGLAFTSGRYNAMMYGRITDAARAVGADAGLAGRNN